ncbi:MAG: RNA methyltransferase [Lentisphaeria bacterium]|nr:RNA methyltransferase [Lentisphaeria bacterium]
MASFAKKHLSLIRSLSSRHGRKESGLCFCDGIRSGSEILSLRPDLVEYLFVRDGLALPELAEREEFADKKIVLPRAEFDKLRNTEVSQGLIVVARRPETLPEDAPLQGPFSLILDKVGDPGNLGTIIRTARAAGLREIFLTEGSADAFSDKVIRAASGAQFAVAVRSSGTLSETAENLRKKGVERFFRTAPRGGKNLYAEESLYEKSAIVLGSEGAGADPLANAADVTIPMLGDAESLNVAQAATIVLFEYVRRKAGSGPSRT